MMTATTTSAASTVASTATKVPLLSSVSKQVLRSGLSGAIGGVLQVIMLMWLRTVTSYQYKYDVSMFEAFHRLYKEDGILRFYRGWQYALLQGPLARFGSVASNELSTWIFLHYVIAFSPALSQNPFVSTLLGGFFVTIWRMLLMPLDTCKTVAQVEGAKGLTMLFHRVVVDRHIGLLFEGTAATLLATFVGHYPWFVVHNYFEIHLPKSTQLSLQVFRNALIGFLASAISDTCTNSIRVVKTIKQSSAGELSQLSYWDVLLQVYREGGLGAIFGRGLLSRILSNGLQSIIFTVVWKLMIKYWNDSDQAHKKKESTKTKIFADDQETEEENFV